MWFLAELLDVTLVISCLFESGQCFEHEVICHCDFDLLLPNFNDFQHIFTCLLTVCLLWKMSVQVLCLFFNRGFVFCVDLCEFFIYFGY